MSWTCPRCRADYQEPRDRCESDGWKLVKNMAGLTIGERYFVEKLIGIGGMRSTVWRSLQRPTDRPVAVKILPAATAEEAQRFERGARIASNLNHPHITTVHDYGTSADGMFYLVMEMLEGQTLQNMLRTQPIGLNDTLVMADQILRALEHAHALNVVHRDLKPANLFVTKKNDDIYFMKILDFGLAKLATTGTESNSDEDDQEIIAPPDLEADTVHSAVSGMMDLNDITQAQRICGTPEYMAPEQILGAPLDRRSDLYALGVILYRMVSGQLPFRSKVRHELYQQHLSTPPPPFAPALDLPEPFARLIMKALAKRPADRFADASEMRIALRNVHRLMGSQLGMSLTGLFPSDTSVSKPAVAASESAPMPASAVQRRRWAYVAAAAALLAAITVPMVATGSCNDGPSSVAVAPATAPRSDATLPLEAAPSHVAPIGAATQPAPSAPAVVAAPPAPVKEGSVVIVTTPSGAEVVREGVVIGRSPMSLRLREGEYQIELRLPEFAPSQQTVQILDGAELKVEVALVALAAANPEAEPEAPVSRGGKSTSRRTSSKPEPAVAPPPGPSVPAAESVPVRPTTAILGRDVAAPTVEKVNVLGRDVTQDKPPVKVLGSDTTAPTPPVKVLGQ